MRRQMTSIGMEVRHYRTTPEEKAGRFLVRVQLKEKTLDIMDLSRLMERIRKFLHTKRAYLRTLRMPYQDRLSMAFALY